MEDMNVSVKRAPGETREKRDKTKEGRLTKEGRRRKQKTKIHSQGKD